MSKMKPILFNTPMTQAILDDRKSCTRRDPFQIPAGYKYKGLYWVELPRGKRLCAVFHHEDGTDINIPSRYQMGDILWVRETFFREECTQACTGQSDPNECLFNRVGGSCYGYKTQYIDSTGKIKWHPSIHMPREAARLFLRVTNVRVERLQNITEEEIKAEGTPFDKEIYEMPCNYSNAGEAYLRGEFMRLWNFTIKPAKLPLYGWDASPWVWAYGFQKITREEAMRDGANSISR